MQKLEGEIYLVGGAVRDKILDIPVTERDWLVVGSSIEAMLNAGFRQIDERFPVFIHPETNEEYALARREKKVGPGYKGFEFDCSKNVTLEEDLKRRDLTINAMAIDSSGNLVDIFNGLKDIESRKLRHISESFGEDPLRIFRIARFASKLGKQNFRLAHSTHKIMLSMIENGVIEELTLSRINKEMNLAFESEYPWRFFEVLQSCNGLYELLPGLSEKLTSGHTSSRDGISIHALKAACNSSKNMAIRFAALFLQISETTEDIVKALNPDKSKIEMLKNSREFLDAFTQDTDAIQVFSVLKKYQIWHKESQFSNIEKVIQSQPNLKNTYEKLQKIKKAILAINAESLADKDIKEDSLGRELNNARFHAVKAIIED